jgi:hypothetical protein
VAASHSVTDASFAEPGPGPGPGPSRAAAASTYSARSSLSSKGPRSSAGAAAGAASGDTTVPGQKYEARRRAVAILCALSQNSPAAEGGAGPGLDGASGGGGSGGGGWSNEQWRWARRSLASLSRLMNGPQSFMAGERRTRAPDKCLPHVHTFEASFIDLNSVSEGHVLFISSRSRVY